MAKTRKRKSRFRPVRLIGIGVGVLLALHGLARIYLGIVDEFGEFLQTWDIPFAAYLAWGITILEVLGGAALVAGKFVVLVSLCFIAELIAGIALVHWPEGWFVVGAGRNGMEYSALLVLCLVVLVLDARGKQ